MQPLNRSTPVPPSCPKPGRLRRLASFAAIVAAAGAAAALLVLLVGRVASDRWAWSQPLFWIPGVFPAIAAAALGALALGAASLGRWRGGRRGAGVVLALSLCAVIWVGIVEWRALNLLRPAPPPGALRILAWNATDVDPAEFERSVAAQAPDILIAINPPLRLDWIDFAGRLWDLPPEEAASRIRGRGAIIIASRFSSTASGATTLGLQGLVAGETEGRTDPGQAAFATLDLGGAGLTIWAIDLPSDPDLSRSAVARQAAEAIPSAARREYALSERGDHYEMQEATGFPSADVILGDFNTTRGAASLAPLTQPLRDAHAAAGLGPDATWPRPRPLLGLDQAFVGRGFGVWRYEVIDGGAGSHWMQRVEIGLPERAPDPAS